MFTVKFAIFLNFQFFTKKFDMTLYFFLLKFDIFLLNLQFFILKLDIILYFFLIKLSIFLLNLQFFTQKFYMI